jgi:arabinogalactan endo-1,4-beta-galactosidase
MTLYRAYAKESAKVLAYSDWPETEKELAQAKAHFEKIKDQYQDIVLLAASTEVTQAAFDTHRRIYEALSRKQNYSDSIERAATARRAFIEAARKELGLDSLEFTKRKDLGRRPEHS